MLLSLSQVETFKSSIGYVSMSDTLWRGVSFSVRVDSAKAGKTGPEARSTPEPRSTRSNWGMDTHGLKRVRYATSESGVR